MLINFCDRCLRTDVICSTICTEGYEASNLVNNCNKGFLAYSCIKPPVTIDFIFISNIQISHINIWPEVGAQKSCGFKLSIKSSDKSNQSFTDVSTGFLQKKESGLLFCQKNISYGTEISVPINFSKYYIKALNILNYTSTMRLTILKTDKSVPALGKIEIWGRVSPKCSKDMAMNIMALWMNRFNNSSICKSIIPLQKDHQNQNKEREQVITSMSIPEDFVDPITFEIMTQPIILPSGKIIDQQTLEKHGHNEALWGKPVSDPFTGIYLNDVYKPISALPLKSRIDKFLLQNSNEAEIKRLPRVLGTNAVQCNKNIDIIPCMSSNFANSVSTKSTNANYKRILSKEKNDLNYSNKKKFHGHILPVLSVRSLNTINRSTINLSKLKKKGLPKDELLVKNAIFKPKLISNIQVNNGPICKCCSDNIFYKLPCEHIICRNTLLSLKKNECTNCNLEFKTSDPQRFHLCN